MDLKHVLFFLLHLFFSCFKIMFTSISGYRAILLSFQGNYDWNGKKTQKMSSSLNEFQTLQKSITNACWRDSMGWHSWKKKKMRLKWNSRVFFKHFYIYENDDPNSENGSQGDETTTTQSKTNKCQPPDHVVHCLKKISSNTHKNTYMGCIWGKILEKRLSKLCKKKP